MFLKRKSGWKRRSTLFHTGRFWRSLGILFGWLPGTVGKREDFFFCLFVGFSFFPIVIYCLGLFSDVEFS